MKKKTFCLISPWMALGGADRCGVDLLKLCRELGHRTITVTTRHEEMKHLQRRAFSAVSDDIYNTESEDSLIQVLTREQPDWILINNAHEAYDHIDQIRSVVPDAQISALMHMLLPRPWDFERKILAHRECFDHVLTVSKKLASDLRVLGVENAKHLYWFGFDPSELDISNLSREGFRILCPFRLHGQKRPMMLVPIAKTLREIREKPFEFLITGSGNLEKTLRQEIRKNGLDDFFVFEGEVQFRQMHEYYAKSDVLLCPSLDEGIPLIYYEAEQYNLPIVASDVGAVSEMFPKENLVSLNGVREVDMYAYRVHYHLENKFESVLDTYGYGYNDWVDRLLEILQLG